MQDPYLHLLGRMAFTGPKKTLDELCKAYHRTPRWRWLRRLHLERQIMVANALLGAYYFGLRMGENMHHRERGGSYV